MGIFGTHTFRVWLRRHIVAVLAVLILAGFGYRWRYAPIAAEAHRIDCRTVVAEVFGTGTLEAKTHAVLGAQIAGRIASIAVDQGDRVRAGQILARLDDSELRHQAESAEASLAAARAGIERLKAERARAQVIADQAKRDHERAKSLLASKVQAESEAEKSAEKLAVAQADLLRSGGAIAEAEAQVCAAEKAVLYHQARLGYAAIAAPCDGLVILRHRDPGDVVVPGSAILEIIATDVLWISAWVDETEMPRLKAAQPARAVFRGASGQPFPGTVERLGRQVDRETREFIVDVTVNTLPENWAVGQRAEVYIETARRENVPALPSRFLSRRDGKTGAWVMRDGVAVWRAITIGLCGREQVEVVDGLAAGDTVLIPSVKGTSLAEGRKVTTP